MLAILLDGMAALLWWFPVLVTDRERPAKRPAKGDEGDNRNCREPTWLALVDVTSDNVSVLMARRSLRSVNSDCSAEMWRRCVWFEHQRARALEDSHRRK